MSRKLATRTVTDGDVSVTVTEAVLYRTIQRIGMYRAFAEGKFPEGVGDDETMQLLVQFNWPDLVCGTLKVEGLAWPLVPREVADLPTAFVNDWREAIWAVNPDWNPDAKQVEVDPKNSGEPPTG